MACSDITTVRGLDLLAQLGLKPGDVDVVAGGPPCQGFSMIGKRALDDPRNALVREFVRVVGEVRPRAFVFENVQGLTVGKHRAFLDEVISEFRRLGYRMTDQWQVLDASWFGVPQRRRRLFLMGALDTTVAYPAPTTRPADLLNPPLELAGLPIGPTVRDAIFDLPDVEARPELMTQDWIEFDSGSSDSPYAELMSGRQSRLSDYSFRRRHDGRLTGLKRAAHTELSRRRFAETEPGATEPVSRFKKLAWSGLCNTLRAGTARNRGAFTSPRPIHPAEPRCINVREAARLHSFPDWFSFHATVWHGFRQIGNSVPPLLAEAVATEVRIALDICARRPRRTLPLGREGLRFMTMGEAADHFSVAPDVIPHRVRGAEFGVSHVG